jgi:hypothetical protein
MTTVTTAVTLMVFSGKLSSAASSHLFGREM